MATKMSKLNILRTVIHENYQLNTRYLEETECHPRMRIDINDEGIEYLVCKFDRPNTDTFPFFFFFTGLNKICDYVVFFERRGRLQLIISELKKGKDNTNANHQLKASEEFLKYIIKTANRIGLEINIEDCNFHKVRFSEANIRRMKHKTKMHDPLHSYGEGFFDYKSSELRFKYFG